MLNQLTIRDAHEGLKKKDFTAVELAEACFGRAEKVESSVHAFLSFFKDSALAQAADVDRKISGGHDLHVLEGIPCGLKDNILVKGEIATSGSKILENYISSYDATVTTRLTDVGVVIMGKCNMDEFAMGSSTESSAFGPTMNPWDVSRVPGGTSGGSVAAVAADECLFTLGSDTGGSIRQPASFCGVVGLKPTNGSVSRYGLMAMASSFDQIGPVTRSVEDAVAVFQAISGPDRHDSTTAKAERSLAPLNILGGVKGMKIGVPREYFVDGMDKGVESAVRASLAELESQGAELIDISLPHTSYALAVYYIIMPAELSANMARYDGIRYGIRSGSAKNLLDTYVESRMHGLGDEVRRRIMLGTYVLSSGYTDEYYHKAQKVRALVRRDFAEAFTQVDCIVTPTAPDVAFKLGEKVDDPLSMYLSDIFTVSANLAGIPALSVPCGFVQRDGKDLPIGLQFFGPAFGEEVIFRAAHCYEQATEWHTRRPSL